MTSLWDRHPILIVAIGIVVLFALPRPGTAEDLPLLILLVSVLVGLLFLQHRSEKLVGDIHDPS